MIEDFRVKSRSDEEIERIALNWRKVLSDPNDPAPDVVSLIRVAGVEFKDTAGLELVWRSDAEMGNAEAYALGNRIFASETVRRLIELNDRRSRMTLAHEFGHRVLHPAQVQKPRLASGNRTPRYIPAHASAEHQARVFAAAFLMPAHIVRQCNSPEQLARICHVTLEAARVRFEQVIESKRPREVPSVYLNCASSFNVVLVERNTALDSGEALVRMQRLVSGAE